MDITRVHTSSQFSSGTQAITQLRVSTSFLEMTCLELSP